MVDVGDFLLEHLDKLEESKFFGRWIIEFKEGRVTLLRFERTELPPKSLYDE